MLLSLCYLPAASVHVKSAVNSWLTHVYEKTKVNVPITVACNWHILKRLCKQVLYMYRSTFLHKRKLSGAFIVNTMLYTHLSHLNMQLNSQFINAHD